MKKRLVRNNSDKCSREGNDSKDVDSGSESLDDINDIRAHESG